MLLAVAACGDASDTVDAPRTLEGDATTTTGADTTAPEAPVSTSTTVGDRPAAPSSTTATTAPPTLPEVTEAPTETDDGRAENGFPVIEYFEASERICIAHAEQFGNPAPDPARFENAVITDQLDAFRTVITDGTGTELVVDISQQPPTISLLDSTAALPFDLSFGCPPELYVGFAAD